MSDREKVERPDFDADDGRIADAIWDRIGAGQSPRPISEPLRRVAEKLGLNLEPIKPKGAGDGRPG